MTEKMQATILKIKFVIIKLIIIGLIQVIIIKLKYKLWLSPNKVRLDYAN